MLKKFNKVFIKSTKIQKHPNWPKPGGCLKIIMMINHWTEHYPANESDSYEDQ